MIESTRKWGPDGGMIDQLQTKTNFSKLREPSLTEFGRTFAAREFYTRKKWPFEVFTGTRPIRYSNFSWKACLFKNRSSISGHKFTTSWWVDNEWKFSRDVSKMRTDEWRKIRIFRHECFSNSWTKLWEKWRNINRVHCC